MHLEKIKISEIKLDTYNPRQMTEEQARDLEESLKRFGLVDPLIINRYPGRENILIGGHQRLKVAKRLGYKEMDCVAVKVDLEKERELNLRLNKNQGDWDFDLLANFDEEVLKDVGFDNSEMDSIFQLEFDKEEFDQKAELEKILAGNRKGVKTGDVWQLGDHKLIIGDCAERANWEKLFGYERFDFMFTDPPYKISYCKYGKVKKAGALDTRPTANI